MAAGCILLQDEESEVPSLEGFELQGDYEKNNLRTVRCALKVLKDEGFAFDPKATGIEACGFEDRAQG